MSESPDARPGTTVPDWNRIACIDWLEHRWRFELKRSMSAGRSQFEVVADGVGLGSHPSVDAARRWIEEARPSCLAELIARHPELHPVEVIIDSMGTKRLGRIRPELWGGYDGLIVNRTATLMTVLSAKARAAFRSEAAVFVRVRRVGLDRRQKRQG